MKHLFDQFNLIYSGEISCPIHKELLFIISIKSILDFYFFTSNSWHHMDLNQQMILSDNATKIKLNNLLGNDKLKFDVRNQMSRSLHPATIPSIFASSRIPCRVNSTVLNAHINDPSIINDHARFFLFFDRMHFLLF